MRAEIQRRVSYSVHGAAPGQWTTTLSETAEYYDSVVNELDNAAVREIDNLRADRVHQLKAWVLDPPFAADQGHLQPQVHIYVSAQAGEPSDQSLSESARAAVIRSRY